MSDDNKLALERIIFFSDAVFAIAITLLALELRVPEVPLSQAAAELPGHLLKMTPKFVGFVVSFLVIGIYWAAHHHDYQFIKRYDRRLLWINLLMLMFIAFLPFPTAMLGTYPSQQITVSFYAASVAGLGLARWLLWRYACGEHRLIDQNLDAKFITKIERRALVAPAIFLLSIGIAAFSPMLAMFSWALISLAYVFV